MLFNSIEFALFLPIVFFFYWFVFNKNIKQQNALLLLASYIFYGWWSWKYLILIFISTMVDFFSGIMLQKEHNRHKRKVYLFISIFFNLGMLMYFKYANFFIENFVTAFTFFGYKPDIKSLNIVLPVGISFYTFQTMSYTIDIYRKKMLPTKDFIAFATFVSFFPQLVAGPIERAIHLLPQFFKPRKFDYSLAADGMRQILWGVFKKVVIADTCAKYVDIAFSSHESMSSIALITGAVLFAFQIYGDFSGYSDVAIGTARLFGFDLMQNFAFPYFSRDIAEFWRRWHISLSTWFRDYVYIPLGGSRGTKWKQVRNTMAVFLISGFWHGANWTFIAWGFLNALYFLPLLLLNKNRHHLDVVASGKILPSIKETFMMFITFGLTVLAWIFFRAQSVAQAVDYIKHIFAVDMSGKGLHVPKFLLLALFVFILN